jgi:ubiquinone/menaquinone biosynthesis C-methylase UbiE
MEVTWHDKSNTEQISGCCELPGFQNHNMFFLYFQFDMKDNFSKNSDEYARFRPGYPDAVFDYLKSLCKNHGTAWDCATGNGQVAEKLSVFFDQVYATDISQNQMDHAPEKSNIEYAVQPAEHTDFPDDFFDLIVVAQAIHWFDFDAFYAEVRRTGKPQSILAVLGYGLIRINSEMDPIIQRLYIEVLGEYWDPERKYIEEHYRSIPFPFEELEVPEFRNKYFWTYDQLIGYLHTWSAVKHYIEANGQNPIESIADDLKASWGETGEREVEFSLLLRVGKI